MKLWDVDPRRRGAIRVQDRSWTDDVVARPAIAFRRSDSIHHCHMKEAVPVHRTLRGAKRLGSFFVRYGLSLGRW